MATFAGFGAAAALNPFPKIISAAAQESTPGPEPAESQVLRWLSTQITRLSIPGYGPEPMNRILPALYMTPFTQDLDGNFHPGICADYSVSDDRLTYTFHMNPDAKWSDGTPVTSGDIKFTWEWMANTAVSGNPFNGYQTQMVEGNAEVLAGTATEMSGLATPDDATLQITLTAPFAPFIYYCSDSLLGAHQRANIENGGENWDTKPTVASGPFMVEQFDQNTGAFSMVQNPYWWGTKPTIQRVEFTPVTDAGTALLSWTNDECEVWSNGGTVQFYKQFGGSELIAYPGGFFVGITFNTQQAPLDDIHVRRAIQRAIDVETAVKAIYGDFAAPATGIASPNDPSYVERTFLFDVDAAKAELAQSAYANGSIPSIQAVVTNANDWVNLTTVFQQMLKDALGIDLQVIPADQATTGQEDAAGIRIIQDGVLYLGPGSVVSWAYHKNNSIMQTWIRVADDDVEAFLNQGDAASVDDVQTRAEAYRQAEQLMLDRAYVLPLDWGPVGAVIPVKKRVVNASNDPSQTFDFINTYIAKE